MRFEPSADARPWSNLASVVYLRTYARSLEGGRKESWADTVERVVRGNTARIPVSEEEKNQLGRFMMDRKVLPGGRGLWMSGTEFQERNGGTALTNCFYWTADSWENWVHAQDNLMLGGGVGMSVEHRYVSKLPKVKKVDQIVHKYSKDADFIVPDSREGWNELLRRVLEAFFVTGRSFSYSTVVVRPEGEAISGFGGTASGPRPLISMVGKLFDILNGRAGRHVRPIDAADILCCIGEMVVAGNVRRSACIVLGDPWDREYLRAKDWSRGSIPNYRANANWSIVADDMEDVHPDFWKTYENGEPYGIVNRKNMQKFGRIGEPRKDPATGTNPCQPAHATVLTPEGIRTFADIDEGSTIWGGSSWVTVTAKWSTGVKPVFNYRTNGGVFTGTCDHRIVSNGLKMPAAEAETIDVNQGPVPEEPPNWDYQALVDGWTLGDGYITQYGKKILIVGDKDQDIFSSPAARYVSKKTYGNAVRHHPVQTTLTRDELQRLPQRSIPTRFVEAPVITKLSFLRGLFSANGSVFQYVGRVGNKLAGRVTLKSTCRELISQVQYMLSSVGIASYVTKNRSAAVEFANGTYTCRESYDLNLNRKAAGIFERLIGFEQSYKTNILRDWLSKTKIGGKSPKISYEIHTVESVGEMEVFDITVDHPEHTYWTGGVLVSNCAEISLENGEPCNLVDLQMHNLKSVQEFREAARLMFRYAKRVTCEPYHNPVTQAVVARNRRTGVGLTGCLQSDLFVPGVLDLGYGDIQAEDALYSAELGIPRSVKTTTIKPAGTGSKVADAGGYEGIHPGYSRYMVQRIRIAANDPLVPLLKAAGHKIEPVERFDGTLDHSTLVVDFYQTAPKGYPVADEDWTTWRQLDVLKMVQEKWSDNSVSVTVYYKREDIPELKKWLAENLKYLKSISFLCHSDHGFKQAPKEAITQEQYEKLSAKIKPVDLSGVVADGDLLDGLECSSGVCPIR